MGSGAFHQFCAGPLLIRIGRLKAARNGGIDASARGRSSVSVRVRDRQRTVSGAVYLFKFSTKAERCGSGDYFWAKSVACCSCAIRLGWPARRTSDERTRVTTGTAKKTRDTLTTPENSSICRPAFQSARPQATNFCRKSAGPHIAALRFRPVPSDSQRR